MEVTILNKDIGFIRSGQDAVVKVDSFPYTRYGHLKGRVENLSHDAIQDEKLGLIYQGRVALAKNSLVVGGDNFEAHAGHVAISGDQDGPAAGDRLPAIADAAGDVGGDAGALNNVSVTTCQSRIQYFREKCVRLGSTAIGVIAALILVAINIIARLGDLPPRVMNVTCVLSFVFFTYTVLPQSLLGFALTLRQWGDIYRRELDGIGVPTASEFRRAAARSLVVLTTVVLLSVLRNFYLRNEGEHKFLQSTAVLIGMESGFVIGYLLVIRRRS